MQEVFEEATLNSNMGVFRDWLCESESHNAYQDKYVEKVVQAIIEHFGGAVKDFNRVTDESNEMEFTFSSPCGVYGNRAMRLDVDLLFDNFRPWSTSCSLKVAVYLPNKYIETRLGKYRGFYQYYSIDLLNIPGILTKIPSRFQLASVSQGHGWRERKIRATTWTPDSVITLTRFQPENIIGNYVWVDVQGWVSKDERFQFDGKVEFSVKGKDLGQVVDYSALDFVTPGAEKLIVRGLNAFAQRYNSGKTGY